MALGTSTVDAAESRRCHICSDNETLDIPETSTLYLVKHLPISLSSATLVTPNFEAAPGPSFRV